VVESGEPSVPLWHSNRSVSGGIPQLKEKTFRESNDFACRPRPIVHSTVVAGSRLCCRSRQPGVHSVCQSAGPHPYWRGGARDVVFAVGCSG
jgi:hypothetical protein